MEQPSASTLWIFLLSGMAAAGTGLVFLRNRDTRTSFFRGINPSISTDLAARLSAGLIAVGAGYLLVFIFAVIPYPHSRPYWVVALSLLLSPVATLGFTAIFLLTIFKRKP